MTVKILCKFHTAFYHPAHIICIGHTNLRNDLAVIIILKCKMIKIFLFQHTFQIRLGIKQFHLGPQKAMALVAIHPAGIPAVFTAVMEF